MFLAVKIYLPGDPKKKNNLLVVKYVNFFLKLSAYYSEYPEKDISFTLSCETSDPTFRIRLSTDRLELLISYHQCMEQNKTFIYITFF